MSTLSKLSIDGIQVEWRPFISDAADGPFHLGKRRQRRVQRPEGRAVCLTINPSTGDVCAEAVGGGEMSSRAVC